MTATPREQFYSISEAATLSGLPASTLRYYEGIGVLPEARRAERGYRTYTAGSARRSSKARGAV